MTTGRYDTGMVLFNFFLLFRTTIVQRSSVVRVAIVRSKGYIYNIANRSSIDRRHVLCDNLFTRKRRREKVAVLLINNEITIRRRQDRDGQVKKR